MRKKDEELVEIQVDSEVLAQLQVVLKPVGLTPEELAVKFIEYCTDPLTQDEAMANLRRWQSEETLKKKTQEGATQ